jgi:SpoVK/Ycf46/Vps4 family AAA+-type ATPase
VTLAILMNQSWEWRKNYRVWEANRRVFVYPENWIEPDQRVSSRTQKELDDVAGVARGRRTSVLLTSAKSPITILAGRAVAASLERDLYRVDLNHVVSKFIGETEKNIHAVFEAAESAHAVLLMDEADALFGKRSETADTHDRFANAEVSYLLQRIDAFDALAMLATNSSRKSVEPLLRRFPFVIDPVAA